MARNLFANPFSVDPIGAYLGDRMSFIDCDFALAVGRRLAHRLNPLLRGLEGVMR